MLFRSSVVSAGRGLLHVTRDAGTLTRGQSITEGQFVQLAVRLVDNLPPREVRLTLTFSGSGKPLTRTIRCTAESGRLLLPAPRGATAVEFAIVFENGIQLMSAETAVLTPRR